MLTNLQPFFRVNVFAKVLTFSLIGDEGEVESGTAISGRVDHGSVDDREELISDLVRDHAETRVAGNGELVVDALSCLFFFGVGFDLIPDTGKLEIKNRAEIKAH